MIKKLITLFKLGRKVAKSDILNITSKFKKCNYRNLSGGIVSIHSGWKV